jgi:hypothetical protein
MADAPELRIKISELTREIESAIGLSGAFLTGEGKRRLEAAQRAFLDGTRRPSADFTWQVPRDEPIWTGPSHGEYERKREKGPSVVGALSFKWQLRTGPKGSKDVFIAGNATTMLRLHDSEGGEDAALSMWRMEVGAHDSPGCCFHTQVLGTRPHPPFPDYLPVPRLPIFPPTPMTCLEFLLSELFQRRWLETVERGGEPGNMWRGVQTRRLKSFLKWQLDQVAQSSGSPLVRLKAFPDLNILAV